MKYKLVVKTKYKDYVKERSKSKKYLEDKAVQLSKNHPTWKIFILKEDAYI